MNSAADLMRILGDEARLRLLRALSREPLNVTELTAVLGLAQSGVSRHLGLLRKADLVTEDRVRAFSWYRLAPDAESPEGARAALWSWLRREFERDTRQTRADDARLEEVRRVRKESFVDHGVTGERRQLVPGKSWAAWARAVSLLLPPLDVADVGCGEGHMTIEVAQWARSVIAIDRSADVLARAESMAARFKTQNVTWKLGSMEALPLGDAAVDVVLLSQALHHADPPEAALAEAYRVLRSGGRVLILDLREHQESWVRARLGDKWLGFSDRQLRQWLEAAGFMDVIVRVGARRAGDPFAVLVASGTKKAERG